MLLHTSRIRIAESSRSDRGAVESIANRRASAVLLNRGAGWGTPPPHIGRVTGPGNSNVPESPAVYARCAESSRTSLRRMFLRILPDGLRGMSRMISSRGSL